MNTPDRQRLQRKRHRTVMLLRFKTWATSLPRKPWTILPLLIFFLVAGFAWKLKERYVILSHPITLLNRALQFIPSILFFSIAAFLLFALLITLSTPRSAKRYEDSLLMIGLTAHDGMAPALIARTHIKHTKAHQLIFSSLGIPRGTWDQRRSEIEDTLNIRILGDILYSNKNRNLIALTAIRGVGNGKKVILYDDEL